MKINAKLLKKVLIMAKRIAVAKSAHPILLNVKIMRATEGETATLSLGADPNSPARLTSERDGYLAVIMPMQV